MDEATSFSIANINRGEVRVEFALSIIEIFNEERRRQHTTDPAVPRLHFDQFYSERRHGPYLDDGRNLCALWFLEHTTSDYLLFIDSDNAITPSQAFDLITTMHEAGVTVCTGVYYNLNIHKCRPGLAALVYEWQPNPHLRDVNSDEPVMDLIPLAPVHLDSLYPQSKPHPIDSSGAGCLAIHRNVFTDMQAAATPGDPTPFFACQTVNGIHMGEDHVFNLRAKSLGHQPHVLPSIEIDHYKTCIVRPDRQTHQ